MSAVARRRDMTEGEFLAWDAGQESRHEYDGHGPVGMVGGTVGHAAIARNLIGLLWQALRGKPCQPYGGDARILVGGSLRYPDALVSCTPSARGELAARDPVVVFEVLSPSTALTDATVKNSEYRATASIQRYVMVDQDRVAAIVFARAGENWTGSLVEGADAPLGMPEIGVTLRLGDLYEGVELDSARPG